MILVLWHVACYFFVVLVLTLQLQFGILLTRWSFPVLFPCLFSSSLVASAVQGVAILCKIMARTPDKIKSIDGSRETLKLAVRITDLWFVGTPNKFEQAEIVIVDSDGDEIYVVCKADQLKSWKADLKENSTYVMHNFKVMKNDGQFRVCEHQYKLVFIGVTVVGQSNLDDRPFKEFRFVEFSNIIYGDFEAGLLTLLASLMRCSFAMSHKKNTRVVFKIKDLSGQVLSCTIWENYCLQFLAYLNEIENDGPMVIILTHARIKEGQGSYPPSVSNLLKASQLLINEPVLEIQEFKERLSDLGIEVGLVLTPRGQGSSQLSGRIVMDNHSWCYPACIQCHKKTDIEVAPFKCGCGKENDQPILSECAELIGQSADEVNRVKIEVRVQPKFRNVVVLRYSNELDLINVVLDMLPDTEQSVFVTADHDPVAGLPLTPKKNFQHAKRSNSAKARINRKRIMQQKRHPQTQPPSQPTMDCTSKYAEYDMIASNSSEGVNFESTQGTTKKNPFMLFFAMAKMFLSYLIPILIGYSELGDQLMQCRYCIAKIISRDKNCATPRFSLCCGDDNVKLPLLQNPPKHLQRLLFDDNIIDSKNYQHNIRAYNMMFAFTFVGIKLDKSINDSRRPPTIRIQDQPCHRIGSLLLMPGKEPKFAQLYIFDTENEVQNRINAMSQHSGIQSHIVSRLSHMLDEHNAHAKGFRMARDRLADSQVDNIRLKLIATREKDGRVYNISNVPKVVALIFGDFDPSSKRDIIVETQNGELQRIHELHSSYLGLQYPLLFPYGEEGYRADILHRSTSANKKWKRNRLTMRQWFAYRLQSRSNEAQTLLHSRKLFQQFIVEGYTMVESERLSYIKNNQKKLRVDKYCSLQSSLDAGTNKGLTKGKRVILPSTFVGSPRYMDQLYFDGMTICSHVGFPNLFITLTCNPNWPEIRRLLSLLNMKATDKPDIVSRIFRLKYEQMLSDLTKHHLLRKGQSLSMVGLYLPKPIFSHGQLYVALSRVNLTKGLKIMIHYKDQKNMTSTTNVIFKEVFRNITSCKSPILTIYLPFYSTDNLLICILICS
ncbi:hypothetical protein HKD37_20G055561 [Glycine soja]